MNIWAIMVQVSVVSMELSVEDTFKNELYKKYESLKRVLIPKPEYFLLINELKQIRTPPLLCTSPLQNLG